MGCREAAVGGVVSSKCKSGLKQQQSLKVKLRILTVNGEPTVTDPPTARILIHLGPASSVILFLLDCEVDTAARSIDSKEFQYCIDDNSAKRKAKAATSL